MRYSVPQKGRAEGVARLSGVGQGTMRNAGVAVRGKMGDLGAGLGLGSIARDPMLLFQYDSGNLVLANQMKQKKDVQQGTLARMVLTTLDVLGTVHGYGIARRIEQISGDLLAVNQGTLYPVLLRLEQEGAIASEWGPSENNRRARFYRLTRAGHKLLEAEIGTGSRRRRSWRVFSK